MNSKQLNIVLGGALVIVVVIAGYMFLKRGDQSEILIQQTPVTQKETDTTPPVTTEVMPPNQEPPVQDEMTDWKTYKDTNYSFSFKYPTDFPFGKGSEVRDAFYIYSVPGPRGTGEVIADLVVIPTNNFGIDVQSQPISVNNLDQISNLFTNSAYQKSKLKTNSGLAVLKVLLPGNSQNSYYATYFVIKGKFVYEFRNWSQQNDRKFANIVASFQ